MKTRQRRLTNQSRLGTTSVEFAMVAGVFILTTFFCFDLGRVWLVTSFVEQSAFETARHISVLGATVDEARPFAEAELRPIGIRDFEVSVQVFRDDSAQDRLRDDSTAVVVTIEVPLDQVSLLGSYFAGGTITRTALSLTNRPL